MGKGDLPSTVQDIASNVRVRSDRPSHVTGIYDSHAYDALGIDNSFDFDIWKSNFNINIHSYIENELVFSFIGMEAPIANAIRRILIAEIPTMAFDRIIIYNNTSIIQDEVLAHRLGLIPVMADPEKYQYVYETDSSSADNTLAFKLDVKCTTTANNNVYSNALTWIPLGNQPTNPPISVYPEILLAKLRAGQEIAIELFAEKGIARAHAKWQACAASYRLLPDIRVKSLTADESKQLVKLCPNNVFEIEDSECIVKRPLDCSMCRECIRDPEMEKKVELRRVRDHFIFSIESVGVIPPKTLLLKSISILKEKCKVLKQAIDTLKQK